MNIKEKVTELTKVWHKIMDADSHKHRDCVYHVKIVEAFRTHEEAEEFKLGYLGKAIEDAKIWAEKVLTEQEKWINCDIESAKKVLEICKKNERRELNETQPPH